MQVYNATEEMQKAANYPNLRLFTVQRVLSTTPLDEPPQILQNWSVASPGQLDTIKLYYTFVIVLVSCRKC